MRFRALNEERDFYEYCDVCHKDELEVKRIKYLELGGNCHGEIAFCEGCRKKLLFLLKSV